MFTGIIEDIGQILEISPTLKEKRLVVKTFKFSEFKKGESIAVNGVCLTVENFGHNYFEAYASEETLKRTNLQFLKSGDKVNLEKALQLNSRIGGHLVSGHVDGLAEVVKITPKGESTIFTLKFSRDLSPFIIPKGSVALDGISLTVNTCGSGYLTVNIIPATKKETTISIWQKGTLVNLETDLIGKYVHSFLTYSNNEKKSKTDSGITLDFLQKYGF
ncbi:riboflavin synthase [Desulfonauticus submarinus]